MEYHHARVRCGIREGRAVTILPSKIALSPEVAEFGVSVANIFLAESVEKLSAAFEKLENVLYILDSSRVDIEKFSHEAEGILHGMNGNTLRDYMRVLDDRESVYAKLIDVTFKLLKSKEFRELLALAPGSFDAEAISMLFIGWRDVHIPLIRRARLSVVMLVFRRAQERGVGGAQLDAGFAELFMAAPQAQTASWQETAHLLAVPESADRLLRSIGTTSRDRTDQIPGLTV